MAKGSSQARDERDREKNESSVKRKEERENIKNVFLKMKREEGDVSGRKKFVRSMRGGMTRGDRKRALAFLEDQAGQSAPATTSRKGRKRPPEKKKETAPSSSLESSCVNDALYISPRESFHSVDEPGEEEEEEESTDPRSLTNRGSIYTHEDLLTTKPRRLSSERVKGESVGSRSKGKQKKGANGVLKSRSSLLKAARHGEDVKVTSSQLERRVDDDRAAVGHDEAPIQDRTSPSKDVASFDEHTEDRTDPRLKNPTLPPSVTVKEKARRKSHSSRKSSKSAALRAMSSKENRKENRKEFLRSVRSEIGQREERLRVQPSETMNLSQTTENMIISYFSKLPQFLAAVFSIVILWYGFPLVRISCQGMYQFVITPAAMIAAVPINAE